MPKKKAATKRSSSEPAWATRNVAQIGPGARALPARAAANFMIDRLLMGRSDEVWSHAEDLARELFDDYDDATVALKQAQNQVRRPLFDELERSIWAIDRRNCEAAYRLGFEVGRRAAGGVR